MDMAAGGVRGGHARQHQAGAAAGAGAGAGAGTPCGGRGPRHPSVHKGRIHALFAKAPVGVLGGHAGGDLREEAPAAVLVRLAHLPPPDTLRLRHGLVRPAPPLHASPRLPRRSSNGPASLGAEPRLGRVSRGPSHARLTGCRCLQRRRGGMPSWMPCAGLSSHWQRRRGGMGACTAHAATTASWRRGRAASVSRGASEGGTGRCRRPPRRLAASGGCGQAPAGSARCQQLPCSHHQ